MSLAYEIKITNEAGGFLAQLRAELADSTELNTVLSIAVAEEVRSYIRDQSQSRHATARRLNAQPTGHLTRVANAVESGATTDQAFILIPAWSGMSRAFREVKITPKNGKKWLTIPANQRSYGQTARDFDDLVFIPLGRKLAMLATVSKSTREMVPMFWLKRSVTIRQDRTLLPSDELLTAVAEQAGGEYLEIIISKGGGLLS